jgi:mannosylglycerate hydrolase
MTQRVHIVPHTHWDREWYLPFQSFRLRLVDVLDDLLPRMQGDPSYARFLLDGQLAVVDDYLAVRPEAADTIRDLVGNGRLSVGPWYTLPDEFLVSGETLIRDLQLGLRVASRFGGAMAIGYLPDMFGHVAQMPQILAQFGFDQAVLWRGVPKAIDRSGFWWTAPDGSTVRAEYLPQGYGNGATLPDDAKALVRLIGEFDELWSDLLAHGPILWMNGTDHQAPQPWLGRVVAEANAIQDDYELVVSSLPEHLATAPTDGLPTWQGELRSGARANLLMGVVSNRVDVRQAAARAERALEQLAEPLAALFLPAEDWPAALLDDAWLGVVRNAAHDSVCACSVDEVCNAVVHRYAEATQIAEGLTDRALRRLGQKAAHDGHVIVNPSARPRSGLVELTLTGDTAPPGTQVTGTRPAERVLLEGPAALVVPATEEVRWDRSIDSFALEAEDGTVLVSAQQDQGALFTPGVRAELAALEHSGPLRLRVRQQPTVTVLAYADQVPGYGWVGWPTGPERPAEVAPVQVAGGTTLDNGLVRVEVDPDAGTFALDGHGGLGRLVDGGDCGDTYNWCPPADDTVVEVPDAVDIEVAERGPLRARIRIRADYRWPERCAGLDRRVGEVAHSVVTTLELRAGEELVRVEVHVDNRSRDHRLRAHFPLPQPAATSRAECAFATVERGLEAEGGPTEAPLATYPARRFVQAGGLTVVHDALAEYELVDHRDGQANELALTLLRSSGMLSQGPMPTRPLPAGPLIPLEGSQLQKPVAFRYALALGDADVDPYALADQVLVSLLATRGGGAGSGALLPSGGALSIDGAEVSTVRREGGGLRVRVFNPTATTSTVSVPGRQGWLVDLRDRPLEPFDERFELRPWGIATLALRD